MKLLQLERMVNNMSLSIYEINKAILELVDEETGELTDYEAFENLQMAKEEKIENLCLWIKDLNAEAKAIKEEKDNLAKRQKTVENKMASVKAFLTTVLCGEKFKTPKVVVSYRKSEKVEIAEGFMEWAKANAKELLTLKEPEVSLTAIKEAIKSGREIPFASIVSNSSIQIK